MASEGTIGKHCLSDGQRWDKVPKSCPFTIEEYHIEDGLPSPRYTTFLIREHDQFGEYPHIYAKICQSDSEILRCGHHDIHVNKQIETDRGRQGTLQKVIVLSDAGCGTEVPCHESPRTSSSTQRTSQSRGQYLESTEGSYPEVWNIFTFLEFTLNPDSRIPYLVMTTHCHYDHIMGIGNLPPTARTHRTATAIDVGLDSPDRSGGSRALPLTTVVASSRGKAFVTPYTNLQKHSLAGTLGLSAPRYEVGIWAEDCSQLVYHRQNITAFPSCSRSSQDTSTATDTIEISTPYTILHTPGHTPDSLSWYDADHRVLCVGDSFYLKHASYGAPWGDEPPMPTMFNLESDLADWWRSLHKVLDFVVQKNRELRDEVEKDDREDRMLDDDDDVGGGGRSGALDRQTGTPQKGIITKPDGRNATAAAAAASRLRTSSSSSRLWPFPTSKKPKTTTTRQTGFEPPRSASTEDGNRPRPTLSFRTTASSDHVPGDPWLVVDLELDLDEKKNITPNTSTTTPLLSLRPAPRVHLAASHTTSHADAMTAILEIRAFVAAILRDEIPKRRAADGHRGEEMWLWDYAVAEKNDEDDGDDDDTVAVAVAEGERVRRRFSVLAPLVVIEEGRRRIPCVELGEWGGMDQDI